VIGDIVLSAASQQYGGFTVPSVENILAPYAEKSYAKYLEKYRKLGDLLNTNPAKLYRLAVRGMLPKTNLAKEIIKKLKVYAGSEHPHTAQVKAEVK
jgi:ribosomal protein L13